MIPSFGIKISSELDNMNLDLDNIADFKISDVPPWTVCQLRVLFSLHNDKKSQTDTLDFRTKFHELLSDFLCPRRNFGWHIKIAPSVRYKSCLSDISKLLNTTEANLMKLHRKIKHDEKVCRAHDLSSYAQVQGRNQVKGQNLVSTITQKLLKQI